MRRFIINYFWLLTKSNVLDDSPKYFLIQEKICFGILSPAACYFVYIYLGECYDTSQTRKFMIIVH